MLCDPPSGIWLWSAWASTATVNDEVWNAFLAKVGEALNVTEESQIAAPPHRPLRVIIETDAGGDPDDEQSLVRFLVYANEFDIEGIIANRPQPATGEQESRSDGLGIMREQVEAYGKCHVNLVQHDPRFPTPEHLLSRTVAGYDDTDAGVNLIIRAVDADDARPVWFSNWGTDQGSAESCLKRALDRVLRERVPAGYAKFKSRLRLSSADKYGDHTTKLKPSFPLWVDTFRPSLDNQRWYHRFSILTATGRRVRPSTRCAHRTRPARRALPNQHRSAAEGRRHNGFSVTFVPTGMNDPHQPAGAVGPDVMARTRNVPGEPYFWAIRRTPCAARRAVTIRSPAGPPICRTIFAPAWTGA